MREINLVPRSHAPRPMGGLVRIYVHSSGELRAVLPDGTDAAVATDDDEVGTTPDLPAVLDATNALGDSGDLLGNPDGDRAHVGWHPLYSTGTGPPSVFTGWLYWDNTPTTGGLFVWYGAGYGKVAAAI